jgi:GTP-binding protein
VRFLKHLSRTRLLLHVLDLAPLEGDPVLHARQILKELKAYDPELAARERWLVLNKADLLPPDAARQAAKAIVRRLRFKGPVHVISAATGEGARELAAAVMSRLEELNAPPAAEPAAA